MERFQKFHFIQNFPRNYPFYKRIFAHFVYFITGIIVHVRKNLLTHEDLIKARLELRKGDIVLLGNLREISSLFIKGTVTHAALYVGRKKFVHAIGDGVGYASLHHLFTEYDTLVILRLPKRIKKRRRIVKKAIAYAKEQIGKPYDYEFSKDEDKFFCTELVNAAYKHAGHITKLATVGKFHGFLEGLVKRISLAPKALLPEKFLQGNFRVVFVSHNLKVKKKRLILVED
jgi:hypothetical protein